MAIANVNSAINGATAGTSVTITISLTAGNTVIVGVAIKTTTSTVSSITDTAGNTYKFEVARNNGANARVELWAARIIGAPTSITVNLSAASDVVAAASQYSGVAADGINSNATGTSTGVTITLTTEDKNNFNVTMTSAAGAGTFTATSGTLRQSLVQNSSIGGALMDRTVASAGTAGTQCTISASESWAGVAIELRTVSPAGQIDDFDAGVNKLPGMDTWYYEPDEQEFDDWPPKVIVVATPIFGPWDADTDHQFAQAPSLEADDANDAPQQITLNVGALQGWDDDQQLPTPTYQTDQEIRDWLNLIVLNPDVLNGWDNFDHQIQSPTQFDYDDQESREATNFIILPPAPWIVDAIDQLQQQGRLPVDDDEGRWVFLVVAPPPVPTTPWDTDAEQQQARGASAFDDQGEWPNLVPVAPVIPKTPFDADTDFAQPTANTQDLEGDRPPLIIIPVFVPKTPFDTDSDLPRGFAPGYQTTDEDWTSVFIGTALGNVLVSQAARRVQQLLVLSRSNYLYVITEHVTTTNQLVAQGARQVLQLIATSARVIPAN